MYLILNYGPSIIRFKNFTKTVWRAELIWDFTRENSAVVNAFIKNKSVKGPAYTGSWTSTAKLHYHLHLSQNVGTTKRQISLLEELMIGASSSPGPLDSRHFHDPKTIVVLSCVEFAFWAAALTCPITMHPTTTTTSPEQWYPAKFSGKCSLTYGCSHVGNIGSVNMWKGNFFPEA